MNTVILLAGGTGTRIGMDIPKQFIKILGKPIIIYTLEKFESNQNIDAVEIVCIQSYMDELKEMIAQYNIQKVKWIIEGGSTFQDSAMRGLFYLKGKIAENDTVLIHCANSPMVTDEIINDAIRVCNEHGNGIAADETIMCTCIKDDEFCSSVGILRETIVGLNMPQAFRYGFICDLYDTAIAEGTLDSIDPHTTSLMLAYGKKIYFSKSATNNLKITRKEDLDVFEGLVLLQQKRTEELN